MNKLFSSRNAPVFLTASFFLVVCFFIGFSNVTQAVVVPESTSTISGGFGVFVKTNGIHRVEHYLIPTDNTYIVGASEHVWMGPDDAIEALRVNINGDGIDTEQTPPVYANGGETPIGFMQFSATPPAWAPFNWGLVTTTPFVFVDGVNTFVTTFSNTIGNTVTLTISTYAINRVPIVDKLLFAVQYDDSGDRIRFSLPKETDGVFSCQIAGPAQMIFLDPQVVDDNLNVADVPVYIDGSSTPNGYFRTTVTSTIWMYYPTLPTTTVPWTYYPESPISFTEGSKTFRATFSDRSGHTVPFVATCATPDTTAPVITLIGDNPMNLKVGDTYVEQGATASDNIDGDITSSIVITGTVNTATAGTYTMAYSVSDNAGNTASTTRSIVVATLPLAPGGAGGSAGSTVYKVGDINRDRRVDLLDLALMMANWGKTGYNECDLNRDGVVDKYDFALLMLNWGL